MTNKKIFEFIEQMKNTSDINSVIAKFEKELNADEYKRVNKAELSARKSGIKAIIKNQPIAFNIGAISNNGKCYVTDGVSAFAGESVDGVDMIDVEDVAIKHREPANLCERIEGYVKCSDDDVVIDIDYQDIVAKYEVALKEKKETKRGIQHCVNGVVDIGGRFLNIQYVKAACESVGFKNVKMYINSKYTVCFVGDYGKCALACCRKLNK